jgi:glycosyltransferase involved in cell wall biosynthesis
MRAIFHHPLPLRPQASAASGIRPHRMLEALRALGIEVDTVTGYAAERARAIKEVEARRREGVHYDFIYAESSTEPTLLSEPHHLPLHPRLDFGFLARIKRSGAKLGLFYRDIYWRFSEYGDAVPFWKASAARLFYHYDLLRYRQLVDRLYLPSTEMASYVPWVPVERMAALPPGFVDKPLVQRRIRQAGDGLSLLYVGGIGPHYRMHALFDAVAALPEVLLTVCTRADEWDAVRKEYPRAVNIEIVHASGAGLEPLFARADLCALFVEPHPYRDFAAPVKLYEYIGARRPVIASGGTLSASFVERNGVGWSVPYEARALQHLLQVLLADPAEVERKCHGVEQVRGQHTWEARARQVVAELGRGS